jgi:hypothetical protein
MDIYHSFCHYGLNKNKLIGIKKLHEMSVECALHSYGNIHLITTLEGKEFLKDIPYTSVEIFDENIEQIDLSMTELVGEYPDVWALSKMIAYYQIAKKKKPFFHIDYDVFLFNRLPEEYNTADLVVQHIENTNMINFYYDLDQFEKHVGDKFFYDPNKKLAFNCGIFGGNNFDAIISYFQESMKLLLSPKNEVYWKYYKKIIQSKYLKIYDENGYQEKSFNPLNPTTDYIANANLSSCILEQFWLYQFCEHIKLKPKLIFENIDYRTWPDFYDQIKDRSRELGYVHLMGALKYETQILDMIEGKIKQLKNNK